MLIRTPTDLGAAIRDQRRRLGLDQAALAKRIGVSRQWVISIEQGRSRAELGLVLRALDALGIRLNAAGDNRTTAPTVQISPAASSVDIDAIVSSARKKKR
jgi:y4mF family transcriptional regulator